jgi:hypothetical protein
MATSDSSVAISYNASDIISTSCDRSLVVWANSKASTNQSYDVESMVTDNMLTIPANYRVKIKSPKKAFNIGDTFNISRPGSLNFYATVIDINNTNGEYYVLIDETIADHLETIKTNWCDARNYKMQVKGPMNLLSGVDASGNTNLSVNVYSNQYIKITYGSQEHIAMITDKVYDDEWYGYVINIGNSWGQYNVNIWKQNDTNNGDKLRSVFTKTISFTPEEIVVDHYNIDRSNSQLTNIRLYKSTLEEDKQSNELLTRFSTSADEAIILDNADDLMRIPYIAKQR